MKIARFVLKIVALSLGAAAMVCAIIAYWDMLAQLGSCAKTKIQRTACASEYDDYEELAHRKPTAPCRRIFPGRALLCFAFLGSLDLVPQDDLPRLQRGGHVDEPLVVRAAKADAQALPLQNKGPVHQHVQQL